jgi:hypothetical protein
MTVIFTLIIRGKNGLTEDDIKAATAAANSYNEWLNENRSEKNKPVIYGNFSIHETKKATIVANKIS